MSVAHAPSAAMPSAEAPRSGLAGRAFVHPAFDLLVIGGALSLLVVPFIVMMRTATSERLSMEITIPLLMLATSTHFAASTVRLYTKPGSFQSLPIMTMVFPVLCFVVVGVALLFPDLVGRNLLLLYLTWSPYHYAAQTFGLSSMYSARAGVPLKGLERSLLWWTCMLPFAHAFLAGGRTGIGWVLPPTFFFEHPELLAVRWALKSVLSVAIFVVPLVLLVWVRRRTGRNLPLIVASLLISNGIWWVVLQYYQAFIWATVFHGIQYLAIVTVFHLRDHPPASDARRAWAWASFKFYAACLVLAYLLFDVWPYFFVGLGFTFTESTLVCVAVINLHHFIVDRGIWQIRKDSGNRKAAEA